MTQQKVIKLESLIKPSPLVLEIAGVRHELVPASVDTFIQNIADIESLSLKASPIEELNLAVKLILRGFPTLDEATVRLWSVDLIHELAQIARGASGEVTTDTPDAEPSAEGNAQPA